MENDLVDPPGRHTDLTRQAVLADPHGLQELLQQHFAGMDVGQLFRHVSSR
jgi:hypothetical protein